MVLKIPSGSRQVLFAQKGVNWYNLLISEFANCHANWHDPK